MSSPAVAILKKDLRITRIFWAPMAFSYCVFLLTLADYVWIYLATGAGLVFVAAAAALGVDDRYRTEPLLAALPGTRRSLVAGRYLAWGAFTAAGLALFLACTALIHAGFGERALRLASLVSVKGAAAFVIGTVSAGLIFLPLHSRFGFWRGTWLFVAAGVGLSIVALNAAARLVPGGADGAGSEALLPGSPSFASTARSLRALAWLIDRYLGRPAIVAAAAAVIALLVYLSFRLSVRFYQKRDL